MATTRPLLALAFASLPFVLAAPARGAGSQNGSGADMPALYDDELFTINFKEMPDKAADKLIDHNGSINVIYEFDGLLPDGSGFIPVIDAIQGDGFNPLWQEMDIEF